MSDDLIPYDVGPEPPGGFRNVFKRPERPYCLPGCDRLDGHDGRDAGACMRDGEVLTRGPLDLEHRHVPLPSRCYQSEYGFTVHIKGACECR